MTKPSILGSFFLMLLLLGCTQTQIEAQNTIPNNSQANITTVLQPLPKQTYACPDGTIVTELSNCPKLKCSDGTEYNKCSVTKPKFCQEGQIIDKASTCGCNDGYDMAGQICVVHIDECIDGTAYGHCSLEQPKYCDAGVLVDNASKCGCPGGYKQLNQSCLYARCKDGTLFGKCSDANPFYCTETGELIYKASKCGCENFSSPYIITVADEQCLPLYYSNHDKYVDTPETQYDGSLRITINSIKLRKPDANGVEVLEVDLVAKNIGNQQASIYCWTSMHVIDYAGREYDGKMASGFGDSLNPGLSTSGKCLFEMSSPAAPYKIVFEPLFGGKTDYIISRP